MWVGAWLAMRQSAMRQLAMRQSAMRQLAMRQSATQLLLAMRLQRLPLTLEPKKALFPKLHSRQWKRPFRPLFRL